ncbi:alpha/beta fold hydrolase [Trichloromonas sp.]|uniref:alpha/beta fold hydrolase n=1 Tax=Trichloromonas sp. TaxID=3069249 RepID=UPI003D818CCD
MNAEINGIRMAYDVAGSGPAVLLIHGFPLCRRMWQPQVQALSAAGFRVVVPDLRGFGESGVGDRPGSMDLLADDLVVLMDHLGIERAVVGGMSMGGYVLLNLLARHPQRVRAACFIVTRGDADDETGRGKRNHLVGEVEAGNPGAVPAAFAPLLFAGQTVARRPQLVDEVRGWMAATDPTGLVLGLQAIRDRVDSGPLLPTLKLPSLVIGAREDKAIPPDKSAYLAAQVAGAELCMIDGGGHMVNLEQADAFNACLLGFLQQIGS